MDRLVSKIDTYYDKKVKIEDLFSEGKISKLERDTMLDDVEDNYQFQRSHEKDEHEEHDVFLLKQWRHVQLH